MNRRQFVTLGSFQSDTLPISCRVPQDSVLGPLLFLLYINDFHRSSNLFDFILFADDYNLFYTNKSLNSLERNVNDQLLLINSWLCGNKLAINIEKSNVIIFHPVQKKPYI